MNKKAILLTVVILLIALVAATVLYPWLRAQMQPRQPATTPAAAEAATEETTEATAATEASEPEPVSAPDFVALDWDGDEVHLSDYVGKPIVLNFWAHWCGPCQMEMPEFHAMHEELGGEVTFLMLHVGPEMEEGKEKVTEGGYTFPVLFDSDGSAASYYGITAYPTSLFIDENGNIKGYYIGMMDRNTLQYGIDLIFQTGE